MTLEGKVAIVTGSGRNIGRATALELARRGASVVVNARSNRNEAESVVGEVESFGGKAIAIIADVGVKEQVDAMVDDALSAFGRVDILINNAGLRAVDSITDMTVEQWRSVLAVNLDGPFFASQAVIPGMIERVGGASSMSRVSMPSKAGRTGPMFAPPKWARLDSPARSPPSLRSTTFSSTTSCRVPSTLPLLLGRPTRSQRRKAPAPWASL